MSLEKVLSKKKALCSFYVYRVAKTREIKRMPRIVKQ